MFYLTGFFLPYAIFLSVILIIKWKNDNTLSNKTKY